MSDTTVKEEKVTEKAPNNYNHHESNLASKLFWGLLLILVGGLVLVGNFGLITIKWSSLWRLWPLFIVAAGLSILSFKSIVWRILSVILSILAVVAIAWLLIGGYDQLKLGSLQDYNAAVSVASSEVKSAEVSLDAGASTIKISTADQSTVAIADFKSDMTSLEQTSEVVDSVQKIDLSMKATNMWIGGFKNEWDIKLTRNLPISLDFNAGACDADIDLSLAKLKLVDIDMGASSLVLKLGNVQNLSEVKINSGASSITIRVPNNSGVRLTLDGGLNSKELADLKGTTENTYESVNYDSADKKINITGNIGVSSFKIERY